MESHDRNTALVLALGSAAIVMAIALCAAREVYLSWLPEAVRRELWMMRTLAAAPVVVLLALAFARLRPAVPDETAFRAGLAQDLVWFICDATLRTALVAGYIGLLAAFYRRYLSFTSIDVLRSLSTWPRFVAALLIYDFLQWAHHFARHKLRPFWFFHAVHHSARSMNLLTDYRGHPLEPLISVSLSFVPLFALGVNPLAVAGVAFVQRAYSCLYHVNMRSNFGFLKYFMVTPQSHRIHHSLLPEHRDKNFGVFFTFWDRLFGTLYRNYDEYPETGVVDPAFPLERDASLGVLGTWLRQLAYPFQQLWAMRPRRS